MNDASVWRNFFYGDDACIWFFMRGRFTFMWLAASIFSGVCGDGCARFFVSKIFGAKKIISGAKTWP